jgi:hypothetical protein
MFGMCSGLFAWKELVTVPTAHALLTFCPIPPVQMIAVNSPPSLAIGRLFTDERARLRVKHLLRLRAEIAGISRGRFSCTIETAYSAMFGIVSADARI